MATTAAKPIYIYSTLSNDCIFTVWTNPDASKADQKGRLPSVQEQIAIAGRANVMNKRTITTPRGAVTQVTPEQLEALKKLPTFARKLKRGFLEISDKLEQADKFAKENMKDKDKSAQLTKNDVGMKNAVANSDKPE